MTKALRQKIAQTQTSCQQKVMMGIPAQKTDLEVNLQSAEVDEARTNHIDNQNFEGDPFSADLNKQFTKEVVILYVEKKDDQYYFHIHNSEFPLLESEPEKYPKLSFADHMNSDHTPRTIRGFIKAFSRNRKPIRKLRGWLIKLQELLKNEYNSSLSCLIINDRTDFEIPWEMLDLTEEEPIGAAIAVVRWQDIPDPDDFGFHQEEGILKLSTQISQCCGKIFVYANSQELQAVQNEINVLSKFESSIYKDLKACLNDVDKMNTEMSMLFIASHGLFKDEVKDIYFEEDKTDENRISIIDLYNWQFSTFKESPGLVFMNSCHSGRLSQDDSFNVINPNYRTGFSTFFLERGAKGVIGTLGSVDDRYAASIARNFFDRCQEKTDLTVAEILQLLRREVSKQLLSDKSEENWYLFLYTFMYVYYGHPFTLLQLIQREKYA